MSVLRACVCVFALVLTASNALAAEPESTDALVERAERASREGKYADAVAALSRAIERSPSADLFDLRGSELFKQGDVEASLADFDKAVALRPERKPWHWKRGISLYYLGKYDEGRRQFEGYQTVDDSDVENAVWRYLCMARSEGPDKARAALLKIGNDRRVPMRQIYELFAGRARPEDVLIAAKGERPSPTELNERLFYTHLYLGLYYEAAGQREAAREQMATAAEKHKIGHYMWDVARVHAARLKPPKP